jgi:pseudouridine-5'-phosphate glycosidase
VTPFVLGFLHRESGGRTLDVNRRLIADNAGLAAEVAVAYASLT